MHELTMKRGEKAEQAEEKFPLYLLHPPTAKFKIDGHRLDDHPCRFRFDAQSFASGRFFSPGYPQNYPNNTNCVYEFIAGADQRIIVDFSAVSLFSNNPKGR